MRTFGYFAVILRRQIINSASNQWCHNRCILLYFSAQRIIFLYSWFHLRTVCQML